MSFHDGNDFDNQMQSIGAVGLEAKEHLQETLNAFYSQEDELLQERTLLGYILLNTQVVKKVDEVLDGNDDCFADFVHRRFYTVIKNKIDFLQDNEKDNIVLQLNDVVKEFKNTATHFESRDFIEKGGFDYLKQCIAIVKEFDEKKALTSAKIVKENFEKKAMIDKLTDVIVSVEESTEKGKFQLDVAKAEINKIFSEASQGLQAPKILVEKYLDEFRDLFLKIKDENIVSTGLTDLDNIIDGLKGGALYIIGGRPGMGKTALSLVIANNVIKNDKDARVAYFSLEMGYKELYNRLLSNRLRMTSNKIREPSKLSQEEFQMVNQELQNFKEEHLYIDDNEGTVMNNIESNLQQLFNEQQRLDLVIVDYLQLIESMSEDTNDGNRERLIANVSRKLKLIAKKFDVPVIALTQLNRGLESRQDKRPMLSDIRESGAIEQDADVVIFTYRDDYYEAHGKKKAQNKNDEMDKNNPFKNDVVDTGFEEEAEKNIAFDDEMDAEESDDFNKILGNDKELNSAINTDLDTTQLDLIVAKNRDGRTGTAKCLMIKNYASIVNISEREEDREA